MGWAVEIYLATGGIVLLGFGAWAIWIIRHLHGHYNLVDGAVRFQKMLERLGMTFEQIVKSELAYHLPLAQRLCEQCEAGGECDRILCGQRTLEEAPGFCPNAAYLRVAKHRTGEAQ